MFFFVQVEEMVVNLWNWVVIRRVGLVISEEQKVKCMYMFCDLYYEEYFYIILGCVFVV